MKADGMGTVTLISRMAIHTTENTATTNVMEMVPTAGVMEECTLEASMQIVVKVMECTPGLMEPSMKGISMMASMMGKEHTR